MTAFTLFMWQESLYTPICAAPHTSHVHSDVAPAKTPEIVICPCCETHAATEGMNDHVMILCERLEVSTDEGYLCMACKTDLLERYPEETPAEQNERMGYIPHYGDEDARSWMDILYEAESEDESAAQQAQDVRVWQHNLY